MPQTVRLDLEIGLADDRAFRSGKFADALDYAKVVERLSAFAATNPHRCSSASPRRSPVSCSRSSPRSG